MQQPSTSSAADLSQTNFKPEGSQENQDKETESIQEPCRGGRRNALTPDSKDIEPIKQTEIQEKMSNLTMSSSTSSRDDGNNGDQNNNSI